MTQQKWQKIYREYFDGHKECIGYRKGEYEVRPHRQYFVGNYRRNLGYNITMNGEKIGWASKLQDAKTFADNLIA